MSKKKQKKRLGSNSSERISPTKSKLGGGASIDSFKKPVEPLLFKKENYMLILAGIGLMFIGYLLMVGGSMPDANTWDDDIIYSTRRTLIAPIFILAGLGLEIWAVFKK